ncbi:MAG TPA: RNA polymerase sigma factor SigJ [Acidimicrobiales bacterium]|nr:RNA polymerase sigma factor SigJ [Acidimicrobiales bacterium]
MTDTAAGGGVEQALVADRPRLLGLAYRITGSRVDAEDVVQEAWERVRRAEGGSVERPSAWLTTVVSRLALDRLRATQRRRETYVGPWLPEPVVAVGRPAGEAGDPAHLAEMAESLTFGFLRVLETLSPVERVVFVLADVFGVPSADIATVVGRSPDACRQIASRARRRVRDAHRPTTTAEDADRVAEDLVAALVAGDADRVVALLAPDVVAISDGGPERRAARRPVVGPDRVARLLLYTARRAAEYGVRVEPRRLNGQHGAVALWEELTVSASAITVAGGRITELHTVVNPDKLAALELTDPIE